MGLRYDETVSSWLRQYFQSDEQIDLVIFDEKRFEGRSCQNKPGVPNAAYPEDRAIYQDMGPIHLCSLQSLADLNQRLERKVPIYNFRPNIVVDQVDQPYGEVSSSLTFETQNSRRIHADLLRRIFGERSPSTE